MSRLRRAVSRKHRNKWLTGGFIGVLGCGTSLTPLLEGHVSTWMFVAVTAAAFAIAGISQVLGDGN